MDISILQRRLARTPPFVQQLVLNGIVAFAASPAGQIIGLLLQLSNRLQGPHPLASPESLTNDELDKVSYEDIDMLKAISREPTHTGYAVIGGSGYVGTYIIRLLIMRGETNIRILDLEPPPPDIAKHPSISFVRTDITSLASVRTGLLSQFSSTNTPPTVIFHTAAIIRFWERVAYAWMPSYNVNVCGTDNVVAVAKDMPDGTILIYTSTSDVVLPCPKFLQMGKDYDTPPWDRVIVSDQDPPLAKAQFSQSCYTKSKKLAEQIVYEANECEGLATGILRPGQTIIGPNDRMLTSTLTMPRVPIFDKNWSHTDVCVWDVAAAHLALEDALRRRPEEVSGEAFLITGNGPAWKMQDIRHAVQYYSSKPLVFDDVHPLVIFILAHIVEGFLFLRYYFLLPFFAVFGLRPALTPSWVGQLIYLQPTTLEYMRDVIIDDSRARDLIGYRPQWQTAQIIKYAVDEVEADKTTGQHGLQLKHTRSS